MSFADRIHTSPGPGSCQGAECAQMMNTRRRPYSDSDSLHHGYFGGESFRLVAVFVFGQRGGYPDADIADVLRTIAVGALAAAVATVIDRQVAFRSIRADIDSSLKRATGLSDSLTSFGCVDVHSKFDYGIPFREAKRGELVSWLDTYCPRENDFLDDLSACISRGVEVRMMVIDPGCRNAERRSRELESTSETGRGWDTGLAAFNEIMNAIAQRSGGALQIRYYRDLPGIPMYLIGREGRARRGSMPLRLV